MPALLWIARDRAHRDAPGGESLHDLTADGPRRSGNQDHVRLSSRRAVGRRFCSGQRVPAPSYHAPPRSIVGPEGLRFPRHLRDRRAGVMLVLFERALKVPVAHAPLLPNLAERDRSLRPHRELSTPAARSA